MSESEQQLAITHWVPPTSNAWGNILRPMTIFQVLQEEHSPSEDESGSGVIEVNIVALVAHVISVEINPERASFVLEDGTGRIHADKELDSLTQQLGRSAEAEEEETSQCQSFEHTYVEVMGTRYLKWKPRIKIKSIHPVHGYHQVMYHFLNVIQQFVQLDQPHNSSQDVLPQEDAENMTADDSHDQNDAQHHIICSIPSPSHPVLSNIFSPQRYHPYAALKSLERTIMLHMHYHHKKQQVLIEELAKAIQVSFGCTELQFNLAIQTLLSEAYITCPLDDGYVVITPRH